MIVLSKSNKYNLPSNAIGVPEVESNPTSSASAYPLGLSANPILFIPLFFPITSSQYHPYSFAGSSPSAGCPLNITTPTVFGIVAYTYPLYVHISHIGLATLLNTAVSVA